MNNVLVQFRPQKSNNSVRYHPSLSYYSLLSKRMFYFNKNSEMEDSELLNGKSTLENI